MSKVMKNNAIGNIFISVLFIIIGIILITNPSDVLNIISYIIGGALLFFGGMQIYSYFNGESDKNSFINILLLSGIFSIALGLIIILFSNVFEALIRIIIGFIIIYNGVVKLKTSLDMKNSNIKEWIYIFCISLIILLFGFYVLTTNILSIIGVVTTIFGILSLIQNIIYMKNINKLIK